MHERQLRDNQLRVLWIARIDYSRNSGVKPHVHDDFFQFILVTEGAGSIRVQDQSFPCRTGDGFLFEQGVEHSFHYTADTTTLDFKFIVQDELVDFIRTFNVLGPQMVTDTTQFAQLFHLSCANLRTPNTMFPYRIDVGFKSALLSILHSNRGPATHNEIQSPIPQGVSSDHPIVQQMIAYLKEHLQSRVILQEVAGHMGYHPHYLIDLFRAKTGITPIQYLQNIRLEKAMEFLSMTNVPIADVAERVGLTPHYFSRLFHDKIGISPSDYREQTRTVIGKDIILEQDFITDAQPPILSF
ncbi:AraC family transcriptional regulator [Alicyclobacillus fastidiosus]|uniref:AraC family transcriptional regulator n=1 Tax=Alicyclobacillus fastidiosus TaxID=392011 RepID=A0ABV5A9R3_9BACL|nr:AraC family transcriptional regulator [Alicyclobacillus fastidiosus]WEH10937.1 AraC family transcriptional regulator [Alicyclobacillus fastidiosus]